MMMIVVAGVLLFLTLCIYLFDADRGIAGIMYHADPNWPGTNRFLWKMLYTWAPLPGLCIAASALFMLLAGFLYSAWKKWRTSCLFLVLLLAMGPGLVVNVLLKDHLGRARPREIIEYGGTHHYTEIWEKGTTGANSSFPSGHASVAFYTMAPWFIFRDTRKRAAAAWLILGTGFGMTVGLARMLQGGHFLSDVLWAGGIVYLTGEVLAFFLLTGTVVNRQQQQPRSELR